MNYKLKNKFQLSCGHEGEIRWISKNEEAIVVRGQYKNCDVCSKKDKHNQRYFNDYLIDVSN